MRRLAGFRFSPTFRSRVQLKLPDRADIEHYSAFEILLQSDFTSLLIFGQKYILYADFEKKKKNHETIMYTYCFFFFKFTQ